MHRYGFRNHNYRNSYCDRNEDSCGSVAEDRYAGTAERKSYSSSASTTNSVSSSSSSHHYHRRRNHHRIPRNYIKRFRLHNLKPDEIERMKGLANSVNVVLILKLLNPSPENSIPTTSQFVSKSNGFAWCPIIGFVDLQCTRTKTGISAAEGSFYSCTLRFDEHAVRSKCHGFYVSKIIDECSNCYPQVVMEDVEYIENKHRKFRPSCKMSFSQILKQEYCRPLEESDTEPEDRLEKKFEIDVGGFLRRITLLEGEFKKCLPMFNKRVDITARILPPIKGEFPGICASWEFVSIQESASERVRLDKDLTYTDSSDDLVEEFRNQLDFSCNSDDNRNVYDNSSETVELLRDVDISKNGDYVKLSSALFKSMMNSRALMTCVRDNDPDIFYRLRQVEEDLDMRERDEESRTGYHNRYSQRGYFS